MDWDDMRVFLAVAREQSFSGAARRLGVQHSTVSRRLRLMEDRLGTELLERNNTSFELSEAGEELLTTAERVESEVFRYESRLGGLDSGETGALRVATVNSLAETILMPMLSRFSTDHPRIQVLLEVSNDYVSLSKRDADVAVRLTNDPGETLHGTKLATVASAVYSAAARSDWDDEWLGVNCCDIHVRWTKDASNGTEHRFFVNDTMLTLSALREGLGKAFLPCFIGDNDPALRRWSEPRAEHDLDIWLLYHRDLAGTRRVGVLREHLVREFA